jgi:hypothetical protein
MIKIRPDVIKIKDPESGNYTSLLAIKGEKGDRGENGNVFAYPVGAIYMSVDPTSPASLFGGTWESLKDRFLLGAGDTYSAGTTGGSADAVAVSHYHSKIKAYVGSDTQTVVSGSTVANGTAALPYINNQATFNNNYSGSIFTDYAGEDGTGKNMPPYLAVYMWKRIA